MKILPCTLSVVHPEFMPPGLLPDRSTLRQFRSLMYIRQGHYDLRQVSAADRTWFVPAQTVEDVPKPDALEFGVVDAWVDPAVAYSFAHVRLLRGSRDKFLTTMVDFLVAGKNPVLKGHVGLHTGLTILARDGSYAPRSSLIGTRVMKRRCHTVEVVSPRADLTYLALVTKSDHGIGEA